jgi:aryl-alcohol dehydrogenase-like predicted oxidoreductase
VIIVKHRAFGGTDIKVSELGFGCGDVGGLVVRGDEWERTRAVERALELGINYFDTASMYGRGMSESNLGAALRKLGAKPVVGTKVRLTADEMQHIPDSVRASVERSLERLSLDCVDIIQLHNPIGLHRDPAQGCVGLEDVEVVMRSFRALQKEGKVRFIGFTGLGDTEAVLQAVETAGAHSVQACYNLLNPSAGNMVPQGFSFQDFRQLIQKASLRRMGVMAIRVLAAGALSGGAQRHVVAARTVSPIASSRSYTDDVSRARAYQFLVEEGHTDNLIEAAIRFAISNAAVSTALVGFSSLEQLEQAVQYTNKGPLPPAALKKIEET